MITNFSIIESFISNSCFLILFLTTIYYWSRIIFSSTEVATASNFFAENSPQKSNKYKQFSQFGFLGFLAANILLSLQLIGRWIESGHFPLSGLYESLIFLAWALIFFYLFIEYQNKTEILGSFLAPVVLCILTFTDFNLPIELQQNKPLVPALQSNWLFMHVSVMMLSYAALILGCLFSLLYIVFYLFFKQSNSLNLSNLSFLDLGKTIAIDDSKIRKFTEIENITQPSAIATTSNTTAEFENLIKLQNANLLLTNQKSFFSKINVLNLLQLFENLSYRLIGIGFCFLTLGILSGAVWANETWGSYWSWDPKETWALITWLTFAIYLHTRILQGWKGFKSASIASLGFFVVWFCYLGVNLLGKGLHSYGFFSS